MSRRSAASRHKDQQIHEALVSGLPLNKVAQMFDFDIIQVQAANRRVFDERRKLSPRDAALEQMHTNLQVVYRLAIDGYRASCNTPPAEQVAEKSYTPGTSPPLCQGEGKLTFLDVARRALDFQATLPARQGELPLLPNRRRIRKSAPPAPGAGVGEP